MKKSTTLKYVQGNLMICSFSLLCLFGMCSCENVFESPDLKTYNLKGHVKNFDINAYNFGEEEDKYYKEHLDFDDNGRCVIDGDITVKRNSEGYIVLIDAGLDGEEYEYDRNWKVTSRKKWSTSTQIERFIRFDGDGNPIESELYGEPDPENNGEDKPFGKNKYEYLEKDSHGNWTKCKYPNAWGGIEIKERTIIYYE